MLNSLNRIFSPLVSSVLLTIIISSCQGANVLTSANNSQTNQWQKVTVIEGLEHPWSMVWLPNGEILITERPGRLRVVREGKLDPKAIAGVPEVFAVGQGGLLDVAIHPQFAQNRWIYLTYAHGDREANRTRVARAVYDGTSLRDVRVIFEVSQAKTGSQHFGSRLLWLPDGTLLVAIGDGGNPPLQLAGDLIRKQSQNLQSQLGKIIRINDDGSLPKDNPFAGSKIWSYGHRNIQGISFDPMTRRVWATEHGAKGGDELNLIEKGKNYGWPVVSASQEYGTNNPVSGERYRPGLIDPKTIWTPAIAPSGLVFYTGNRFPNWQGNLFAGGLVSRDIRRLEMDKSGEIINQEAIPIGQRVRDVRQSADGFLYLLTDEGNGQLIRLEPPSNL
ncbi:MAG: PQQ-dependent sugar dehydrogenase [Microcystis sp. M54BS1]|uniref:PQQ-dependent sugar dehydrogenase n=1 Tax=unclassified Microcystis TaxID=2643300 RepID=UPI00257D54A3|nr:MULTISPECIES: PQQ-dependent sugar dehydrogenase [unclassified Microcystis]MCA2540502.1 PQQ-dependent sugar dehydrogenase [Microcystis sp. M54BS1]MCA2596062.1 PQQ-dependent sugar dehydrogenase [Microcystis sp. M38BS1]MCA2609244.1 PQQ-dependent sugar dehydrogenase [Microcystis sp. M27BS1]MCA2508655.1 PQQ-dependent sugar dehydrogenase [Microcystis sp. M62BS1]MCA2509617.1 PQQ-dependent sugar dehydrogenase [Microcystis sp. M60BS1]